MPTTALSCPRDHRHLLDWNILSPEGPPMWQAIEIALGHARSLVGDGCTEPEYADYLSDAYALLETARRTPTGQPMLVEDQLARRACEALMLGVDYMLANDYDQDQDDAWAVRSFGRDGKSASTCYVHIPAT